MLWGWVAVGCSDPLEVFEICRVECSDPVQDRQSKYLPWCRHGLWLRFSQGLRGFAGGNRCWALPVASPKPEPGASLVRGTYCLGLPLLLLLCPGEQGQLRLWHSWKDEE